MLSRLTAVSMTTEEKASTLRASHSNTDRWQEEAADLELGQASLHRGTRAQPWLAGLRNPERGRGGPGTGSHMEVGAGEKDENTQITKGQCGPLRGSRLSPRS